MNNGYKAAWLIADRVKNPERYIAYRAASYVKHRDEILAKKKWLRENDPVWLAKVKARVAIANERLRHSNALRRAALADLDRATRLVRARLLRARKSRGSATPQLPRQSGIYLIAGPRGRYYVGSSANVGHRCRDHWRQLSEGSHPNAKLQNAWVKHGAAAFLFSILECVQDKNNLIAREQFHIDQLSACERGYNIVPRAGSVRGLKRRPESNAATAAGLRGRKLSAERKAKNTAWWANLSVEERLARRARLSEGQRARWAQYRALVA